MVAALGIGGGGVQAELYPEFMELRLIRTPGGVPGGRPYLKPHIPFY